MYFFPIQFKRIINDQSRQIVNEFKMTIGRIFRILNVSGCPDRDIHTVYGDRIKGDYGF